MHRATPFEATGHVRDMRRTTIIDMRGSSVLCADAHELKMNIS